MWIIQDAIQVVWVALGYAVAGVWCAFFVVFTAAAIALRKVAVGLTGLAIFAISVVFFKQIAIVWPAPAIFLIWIFGKMDRMEF